jgi:hypothetical protein
MSTREAVLTINERLEKSQVRPYCTECRYGRAGGVDGRLCVLSSPPVPLSRVISGPEELTICNTESFRG